MKRAALVAVALSTLLLTLAYALPFVPGDHDLLAAGLLAVGTAGILASIMALAAQRNGRLGSLWIPVAFVAVVVGGGMLALVLMPPADPTDPTLWLGLPPRAAVLLYGIGLFPILVIPVAYALTFERLTLSEQDLERVREAARRAGTGLGSSRPAGGPAGDREGEGA